MRNYVGSLTNQLPKLFTTMECLQRTSQLLAFTRCLLPVLNPVTISRHFTHKNSCIFKEMSSKRPSMHQISGCKMLTSRTFHTRTRELPQPVMPSSNLVSRFLPGSSISRNLPSLVGTSWKPWYVPCASFATETTIKLKMRGIQKDVSPLTTKRIIRKKKSKEATELDKEVFDATAYATSEELDLESLLNDLDRQGLYINISLPQDVEDALHVEARYRVDDEPREIFFFREGSVVFWNVADEERNTVLKFMRRHQTDSYDNLLVHSEFENVEFTFTDTHTRLVGDEIQLQKPEEGHEVHHQLEKYTFSNALALSVKLAVWEASLDRYVDSIEWVLQDLRDGKKIKISRDDMLRRTGELFTLRHLINLSSDLLDTPDFYWDRERLEPLYVKTCSHLNIQRRTKVMNDKLNHCVELADLITSHLNDKHHVRLEWMIIILIMVEVAFEIVHLIERYTEDEGSH